MATSTTNTPIEHSSDATFRIWGLEFSTMLAATGLTKASDTGQINWVTVNRPGTNVAAGFEIWHFNDALQSTAPIFIKVEYGTGGSALYPNVWITVGIATNGAGVLVGFSSSRISLLSSGAILSTVTNRISNMCYVEGSLGVSFKEGSTNANYAHFFLSVVRTANSSAVWTADGVTIKVNTTSYVKAENLNFLTSSIDNNQNTTGSLFCTSYGITTSSLVGLTPQVFRHFDTFPLIYTNLGSCSILSTEATPGATATFKLLGSTARTYLVTGNKYAIAGVTNSYFMFLWE